VRSVSIESEDVSRIAIRAQRIAREITRGESVAVSGVCLTVVEITGDVIHAQIMGETQRATSLGSLAAGDMVNLERAMRADGRLDGHIVLGHVDDVGRVTRIENFGLTCRLWASVSRDIVWGIAAKGSVSLDGVSLTVIEASYQEFSVGIIPATLRDTTLGRLSIGDPVNVEIDVIARYIARMTSCESSPVSVFTKDADASKKAKNSQITWDKLKGLGWTPEG
jgi:riboflavin synthase